MLCARANTKELPKTGEGTGMAVHNRNVPYLVYKSHYVLTYTSDVCVCVQLKLVTRVCVYVF